MLHTLGYGRSNPNTPFNRLKRVLGFLALGIIMGIVLWGAVIWIAKTYFAPSDVQDEPPAATSSQSDAGPAPPAIARCCFSGLVISRSRL